MKIALKHHNLVKIFNGDLEYQSIIAFAQKQFGLPAESCYLTYSDDEGDEITMCSSEEFSVLLDLYKEKPLVKLTIKTSDSKELIEITENSETALKDSFEKLVEPTKKEEEKLQKQEKNENVSTEKGTNKAQSDQRGKQRHPHAHKWHHGPHHGPWHHRHHGHHGHHWGQGHSDSSSSHQERHFHRFHKMQTFMNEKIAREVDQRMKVLLPCLQNQLNPQNPIKLFSVPSSLVHTGTECKGCFASPIAGIRYKCLTCPEFSLCENCETTIEHPHNLLKMKFVEEKHDKSMPFCFPGFHKWGRHFSRGHSSSSSRSHSKSKDPQFWAAKKARKLSKIFGGQPQEYKAFIQANKDLHLGETIHKYAKQNNKEFSGFKGCGSNKKIQKLSKFFGLSEEAAQKYIQENSNLRPRQLVQKYAKENNISQDELDQKRIHFKCQKMGKIFEKDPESFRSIVSANLGLRPHQLKRLIMEKDFGHGFHRPWGFNQGCRRGFGQQDEKKQPSPFMKKQGKKSPEQKKEKREKKSGEKRELHQEKKSRGKSFKKENIEKSNILKVMVEYFGTYHIDQYYKLIDEHFSEGQEKIIQLYIDTHAK